MLQGEEERERRERGEREERVLRKIFLKYGLQGRTVIQQVPVRDCVKFFPLVSRHAATAPEAPIGPKPTCPHRGAERTHAAPVAALGGEVQRRLPPACARARRRLSTSSATQAPAVSRVVGGQLQRPLKPSSVLRRHVAPRFTSRCSTPRACIMNEIKAPYNELNRDYNEGKKLVKPRAMRNHRRNHGAQCNKSIFIFIARTAPNTGTFPEGMTHPE
ncbi:Protein of unknown function [Gryllus bimaculatus]|nr:Protein of unknown function [Gryllus bimaculatus]